MNVLFGTIDVEGMQYWPEFLLTSDSGRTILNNSIITSLLT